MPNAVLSKRKRITYLALCVVAFFILAPLVAYYASGYRVGKSFDIAKTGGIYIVIEGKGFSILLNNQEQEVSSIFRRNFFIQNLAPARYTLKVSKEGFYSWGKMIDVTSEKVADVYPFNLPEKVDIIEIPKMILDGDDTGTTTAKKTQIPNEEYATVKNLFASSSPRLVTEKVTASTTPNNPQRYILYKKIALWYKGDEIYVRWEGEEDSAPLYFCNGTNCKEDLLVFKGIKVNNVDLISDKQAYVIFSTDGGIFVTEIDGRGGRNIQSLLIGEGYDFRIDKDQTLYIKKGKSYYKVNISL